MIFTEKFK